MVLFKSSCYHIHQGSRAYQEDSFCLGDNFLIVSDGVGGLAKGNIASAIVTDVWKNAFESKTISFDNLEEDTKRVVQETIDSLNKAASENPQSEGMGSTLACIAVINDHIIGIHVGDSRIYQFSNEGDLKWRSTDHSLVQELVDGGIISEEDAKTHPRRNVITRVLQARKEHSTKAAIHVFENIEDNDIFMACSDGIIESWADIGLESVLKGNEELEESVRIIGEHSAANSGDNNTVVATQISVSNTDIVEGAINPEDIGDLVIEENLDAEVSFIDDKIILDKDVSEDKRNNFQIEYVDQNSNKPFDENKKETFNKASILKFIFLLCLLIGVGYYFYNQMENK